MKKEFLEKLGIAGDVIDKIIAENSADVEKVKTEMKAELETAQKERDGYKQQVGDRDKQLEDLKKSGGDIETLKKTIETLQADNKKQSETHAKELYTLKVDSAVDKALTASKAKNIASARVHLKDLDKAEFNEDGTIKGLKKQIDALIKDESTSFLFDTAAPGFKGYDPQDAGDPAVDISNMTYSQQMNYLAAHPDAKLD